MIVWLFMLDPSASPFAFVLHWFGYAQFNNTIAPGNLPVIFAIMAFWTGAGGWIVVMYGALNNIPHELIESAADRRLERIPDGAADQAAADQEVGGLHARPGLRRGTQLFVEPTVLGTASLGVGISKYWSPNQLAWFVASQYSYYNQAAAISVDLLVFGLVVAAVLVWRGRLFEVE